MLDGRRSSGVSRSIECSRTGAARDGLERACASEQSPAGRPVRDRDGEPVGVDEPRLPLRWTGELAAARLGGEVSSSGSFVYEHRPPRPQCL